MRAADGTTHQSSVGAELMSKTIMLVHGAWVTTDCWTSFRDFLERKGHRVIVPPWPYLDRPAEELRRSPDPRLAKMTIKARGRSLREANSGFAGTAYPDRTFLWRIDSLDAS
jgi:hypothetical protein